MHPRSTGLLLVAVLAVGSFLYLHEVGSEGGDLESEGQRVRLFGAETTAEDVAWIALRTQDGIDARVERREGGWQLVEPQMHPADAEVERIAERLAGLASERVIEAPQAYAEYGLDEASARVVRFAAGGATRELWFGDTTPVGANTYVRVDGSDAVYTVASFYPRALHPRFSDLRDKRILGLEDASGVREIEARWPGGGVLVERIDPPEGGTQPSHSEPEWHLSAPLAARADAEVVYDLLATLTALRADAFVPAPSEATRSLLAPPDFEVALRGGHPDAEPIATLRIGRADAAERRPVQAGGEVFEISAGRIDDFPRDVIEYRHRRLAGFEATDARRLDISFPSAHGDPVAITAERGARSWSSSSERLDPARLSRIVSALSDLQADEIVAETARDADLAELGLRPPQAIVSVFGAAPEPDPDASQARQRPTAPKLAEVHFGRASSEGVIARAAGEPTVYRLAPDLAEPLPLSPDAL